MFRNAIQGRFRSYSTLDKLWVKHNGHQPTQVRIKGCKYVDDAAQKVKQKFNINCQIALFTSLDKEPIKSWLTISECLKTEFKNNSVESPLFVKLFPIIPPITKKTIYIGNSDKSGYFTGDYMETTLRDDNDLSTIIKYAQGLIHPSKPNRVIISFEELKDREKYYIYECGRKFHPWQRKVEVEKR